MHVEAIFRYPIKSMAGEKLDSAQIGWHGVEADRRFAVRLVGESGGFPWLTASKLPELLRFTPLLPDRVRAPDGRELAIRGEELAAEITRLYGKPVEIMRIDHGIFDEGTISVIAASTVAAIAPDVRRFRPNLLIRTDEARAFEDNDWVGSILSFGDDGPVLSVTQRDERCAMVNLDPDSAASDPNVLKTVVRMNDNKAGVYATVMRTGRVVVGQRVSIMAASSCRS